jgi:outer membrane protein OmpA-like peptidoglycan-associated protein
MKRPLAIVFALLLAPALAQAESVTPTLHAEGVAQMMLTETYRDRFDWGGGGTVRAGLELVGPLAIQLDFGTAWFPVADQEPGNLYAIELGARGFFPIDPVAGGPFVDVNAGVGITGALVRFLFDTGVGWDFFPVPAFGLGPVVRYQYILQPDEEPVGDDAHIITFGLNLTVRIDLGEPEPIVIEREVVRAPVDTDGDTVDDAQDGCVDVAEDIDGYQDQDGCPDLDNDSDGFPDANDVCVDSPETRNGYQDDDGCPDEPPVVAAPPGAEVAEELPQQVLFRIATDRVSPDYHQEIMSVCRLLTEERPDVRIRVMGHADEQGTQAGNLRLGAQRAGAVAERLVLCGVAPERIDSASYGDTRPACTEDTDECDQRNRRVSFEILLGP